jgi:hypothetical protein
MMLKHISHFLFRSTSVVATDHFAQQIRICLSGSSVAFINQLVSMRETFSMRFAASYNFTMTMAIQASVSGAFAAEVLGKKAASRCFSK